MTGGEQHRQFLELYDNILPSQAVALFCKSNGQPLTGCHIASEQFVKGFVMFSCLDSILAMGCSTNNLQSILYIPLNYQNKI